MKSKHKIKHARVAEPDDRVERSKRVVLATAHELLTKEGLGGVSVDEISRRCGVAKTTIYRHWPSRNSLLMEACAQLSTKPQAPDSGTLRGDLELLMTMVASRIHLPWSTVLPSIIDAAERDKELASLQARMHDQMRGAFVEVIERGKQRGELPAEQNTSELVAALFGPIFYRRWFSREPVDAALAKRVVTRALAK